MELFVAELVLPDGKILKYVTNGLEVYGFKSQDKFFDERLFKYFEEMNSRLKYLNVKPGDIMLDIGASVGSWSTHAALYGAKVYAFEVGKPQLATLAINKRLNKLQDLIISYDIALCDRDDLDLVFDDKMALKQREKPEETAVYSMSLDTWVEQHRNELPHIDYIKIDVEGMEYDVLIGAYNTLKEYHPKIILEIHEAKVNRHDIENWLRTLDYKHEHIPSLHDYFF